ncbi:MAG TPA: LpqB family beta-propeller domain-containing protein, partial [Candidatus Nanopelagicales bacterium]|nr:LpqB family beta-propeller domain-containing protein [Candidatus Nanopelagicales bacterium]
MTGRAGGRAAALLLSGVALLLVAGCAVVPTSGPINEGPPLSRSDEGLVYRAIPAPPQPDMAPEALVRAFLAASSSSTDDYAVARLFLTREAADSWRPGELVRVYDNTGLSLTATGQKVVATGSLDGTIGADGGYVVGDRGQRLSLTYRLARVDGQWRISAPPDGLTLGTGDISREFRTYNLHFFDPTFSVLVPDPVTVPVSGAGVATGLVRDLLRGPTSWLAPAVRTAFPDGTTLALESVPVDNGIARVALSSQVLAADPRTRAALSAQLVWTLRQLPNVSGVAITVAGQPLTVPGAGPVQETEMWSNVDATAPLVSPTPLYAAARSGLRTLDGGKLVPAAGPAGAGKPRLTRPAVSNDATRLAGISPDRRELLVQQAVEGADPTRLIDDGTDLSAPSWDRNGDLWVVDRGRGILVVADDKVSQVPLVDLPDGLRAKDAVGISLAPDGTRAALLMRRGTRVEPWL